MPRYAARTEVTVRESQQEIEDTLKRYGADAFSYAWDGHTASIAFRIGGRMVRILLPVPDREAYRLTAGRQRRKAEAIEAAWEQATKQRWRALALIVKAKLEAVESGISTVEREFLADVLLPDNRTVGEWFRPQLEQVYQSGLMPPTLPALGPGRSEEGAEG